MKKSLNMSKSSMKFIFLTALLPLFYPGNLKASQIINIPTEIETQTTVSLVSPVAMHGTNVVSTNHSHSFDTDIHWDSYGFIDGYVTKAKVVNNYSKVNSFDFKLHVRLECGATQIFRASRITPVNAGYFDLVSTSCKDNIITLSFSNSVIDIDTWAQVKNLQLAFKQIMKLDDAYQSPAQFTSLKSSWNGGCISASASSLTEEGTYIVRYQAHSETITLNEVPFKFYSEDVVKDGKQKITFKNGFSVDLSKNFKCDTPILQIFFNVKKT